MNRKITHIEAVKSDKHDYCMNIFQCQCGNYIGKDQAVLECEVECGDEKPIVCEICGTEEDTDTIFTMTPEEVKARDKKEAAEDLGFECPKCGGHRIEEILDDCTVTTEVRSVIVSNDSDFVCDYDPEIQTTEGGDYDTIRYQCGNCGEDVSQEQMRDLAKSDEVT